MDKSEIRELIRIFDKSDITKLKIKEGEFSIELQKGYENGVACTTSTPAPITQAPVAVAPVVPAVTVGAEASINAAPAGLSIKSPMVGTFYKSPAPGAAPFANVGAVIRKGQPIGIIEAMKIMNEIEAEFDCKIVEILVEDGQPVEYDMPIFAVEKV